jgi:hypothetical protein
MGAELIVAILCGPSKLGRMDIKKAKSEAKEVIKEAKRISEMYEGKVDEFEISTEMEQDSPLRHLIFHEQLQGMCAHALSYIEDLSNLDPVKAIDEFVAWWNSGSARDTSYRTNPYNRNTKIVVCGMTSYGDSPDGYGSQMVRHAEWLNALNNLGVR